MHSWLSDLHVILQRDLKDVAKELNMFEDEAKIWEVLPGITNPAGTLALHICGNLNHYIGYRLGGRNYKRDRNHEFQSRQESRQEILNRISDTLAMLVEVVPAITAHQLTAPFPEPVGGVTPRCDRFLLHLATHLAHHLGQIGYLRRALTAENKSSHPVSVQALVE